MTLKTRAWCFALGLSLSALVPLNLIAQTRPVVGLAIATVEYAHVQQSRDVIIAALAEAGYEPRVAQVKGYDQAAQNRQIRTMADEGVKVIIIIAAIGEECEPAVEYAKSKGTKLIAYDRPIPSAAIACYLSWEHAAIGEAQARALVSIVPQGRYALLGGSPADPAAHRFREGQMRVLKPLIDSGRICIVADEWADNWDTAQAERAMDRIVASMQGGFDAVLASNDGTALGAIEVFTRHGIKVPITGQDATKEGCTSIAKGELSVTILKDLRLLARSAARVADLLMRDEPIAGAVSRELRGAFMDIDRSVIIPCLLLEPIIVTKENLYELIVLGGIESWDDVYRGAIDPPPRP